MKIISNQSKKQYYSLQKNACAHLENPDPQPTLIWNLESNSPSTAAHSLNMINNFNYPSPRICAESTESFEGGNSPRVEVILPDVSEEIRLQYMKRREKDIPILRDSLDTLDLEKVKHLAHQIKGSAEMYGYEVLGSIASQLEEHAIRSNLAKLDELINDFEEFVFISHSEINL